jgi:iron(III) transport system ATP-binding protein
LVSHDAADTLSWADTIIVLKDGKILQQGAPHEIYHQPIDAYCAGLFGEYNLLNAENVAAFFPGAEKLSLIVRPEQLAVVNESAAAVKSVVEAIYFFGSYYSVDVFVNGQIMRVRTDRKDFSSGDTIYLKMK